LLRGEAGGGYDTFDWRAAWNFPGPPPTAADTLSGPEDPLLGDTVGTVVRDETGRFAVTLSTGGTSITLDGRVGDVPIYGCGSYAGPAGAVACTGHGEEIIRQALARRVYEWMAAGATAREAVRSGVNAFPDEWSVGVIAVGADGWGVAANRDMAYGKTGAPAN
jgi:isoaspartyl peptidase/L-asparaginase-like protein (Ntn-hydrolase superfamily)